jgi:TRAP-type uncharacterized transport system fused permease subunit
MGMGLPTTAAYVLGAAVLIPALTRLGLEPFVAHMFVVYFAALATITPPVCAAVYLGSNVAGSNWVKTGFLAVMIALPGFIVPYTFAYNPALLLRAGIPNIIISVLSAFGGVFFMGVAVAGFINRRLNIFIRIAFVLGGIMMVIPSVPVTLAGLVFCVGLFFINKFLIKKPVGQSPV